MKRAPLVFASSVTVAASIVFYVHFKQEDDIYQMRKGILRERERIRLQEQSEVASSKPHSVSKE